MLAQRVARQSMQRLTIRPYIFPSSPSWRYLAPIITSPRIPYANLRPVATQKLPSNDEILAAQRLNRPVSPHLSIYRPQITWYSSALNRITGSILSGGFYLFFTGYLIAPLFGWHLESQVLAASFAALPVLAKFGLKFLAAVPFTYHGMSGIRHLVWDFGYQMRNIQVARSGWLVMGLTVVSSAFLALYF